MMTASGIFLPRIIPDYGISHQWLQIFLLGKLEDQDRNYRINLDYFVAENAYPNVAEVVV